MPADLDVLGPLIGPLRYVTQCLMLAPTAGEVSMRRKPIEDAAELGFQCGKVRLSAEARIE